MVVQSSERVKLFNKLEIFEKIKGKSQDVDTMKMREPHYKDRTSVPGDGYWSREERRMIGIRTNTSGGAT